MLAPNPVTLARKSCSRSSFWRRLCPSDKCDTTQTTWILWHFSSDFGLWILLLHCYLVELFPSFENVAGASVASRKWVKFNYFRANYPSPNPRLFTLTMKSKSLVSFNTLVGNCEIFAGKYNRMPRILYPSPYHSTSITALLRPLQILAVCSIKKTKKKKKLETYLQFEAQITYRILELYCSPTVKSSFWSGELKKKKSLQHKVFFLNKKPDYSVYCCTDICCTEFSYRIYIFVYSFLIKSQWSGVKPNTNLSQTPWINSQFSGS